MSVTGPAFPIFVGVVVLAHRAACTVRPRAGVIVLLVASYVFYASSDPHGALVLSATTLAVFCLALGLGADRPTPVRRAVLLLALGVLLGPLCYYKVGPAFAADALVAPRWDLLAPIGISFYTFMGASYVVDVYRRVHPPARDPVAVALHLSFFPYVLSGPITRARQLMPQLSRAQRPQGSEIEGALARIALGAVKKVVLAETLGGYVDPAFGDPAAFPPLNVLLAVYAYAFQLYFDFSGYCDIAIGVAALVGIRLPENFNRPYMAVSVRDFWQRWHITLYAWLRDYVYFSLIAWSGNRPSRARVAAYLLLTMAVGGVWHGATWPFLVWGLYHGALLAAESILLPPRGPAGGRARLAVHRVVTFHALALGLVLFRSPTLGDAGRVLLALGVRGFAPSAETVVVLVILLGAVLLHATTQADAVRRRVAALPPWGQGIGWAAAVLLCFAFSRQAAPFIYGRF